MDPFEGVAGFEDTFFEYGEVEAGAAAFGEAADELHVAELGPHFETGFARRRHLEECSTGAEEISGFDLILGDAFDREILTEETGRERATRILGVPRRIVLGRVGIDRFERPAVHAMVGLMIAFETEAMDRDGSGDGLFEDARPDLLAAVVEVAQAAVLDAEDATHDGVLRRRRD